MLLLRPDLRLLAEIKEHRRVKTPHFTVIKAPNVSVQPVNSTIAAAQLLYCI